MDYQIILMTGIAFSAVITVLSFAFNLLLSPIKQNQANMEKEISSMKTDISDLKEDVSTLKTDVFAIKQALFKIEQAVLKNNT